MLALNPTTTMMSKIMILLHEWTSKLYLSFYFDDDDDDDDDDNNNK